jgi:hypothetical protein
MHRGGGPPQHRPQHFGQRVFRDGGWWEWGPYGWTVLENVCTQWSAPLKVDPQFIGYASARLNDSGGQPVSERLDGTLYLFEVGTVNVSIRKCVSENVGVSGVGLGDDFPELTQALNTIATQVKAEGGDVQGAQDALRGTYLSILAQNVAEGNPVSSSQAIQAATKLVGLNATEAGAIAQIGGLLQSAAAGTLTPTEVANAVSGVLIATLVASGAVTAGVGALVAIGLTVAEGAFAKIFGSSAPAASLCGADFSAKPDFAVGCVAVFGPKIPSRARNDWRRFPQQSNPSDQAWYTGSSPAPNGFVLNGVTWKNAISSPFEWNGAEWWSTKPGDVWPIDAAFPTWRVIGNGTSSDPFDTPSEFSKAFFESWKLAAENALNGYIPPPDYKVFMQTLRTWNKAHEVEEKFPDGSVGNKPFVIKASTKSYFDPYSYLQTLVQQAWDNRPGDPDPDFPNGPQVTINNGPLKKPIDAGVAPFIVGSGSFNVFHQVVMKKASSPVKTALITTAGVGILGAIGLWLFAQSKGIAVGEAWNMLKTKTKNVFKGKKK